MERLKLLAYTNARISNLTCIKFTAAVILLLIKIKIVKLSGENILPSLFIMIKHAAFLGIAIWTYSANLFGFVFLSYYDHVPGVSVWHQWLPIVLSTLSSVMMMSALSWTNLTERRQDLGIVLRLAFIFQLVSSIIITIANSSAVGRKDFKNQELHANGQNYFADVVLITAYYSTVYSWLMTCTLTFISFSLILV